MKHPPPPGPLLAPLGAVVLVLGGLLMGWTLVPPDVQETLGARLAPYRPAFFLALLVLLIAAAVPVAWFRLRLGPGLARLGERLRLVATAPERDLEPPDMPLLNEVHAGAELLATRARTLAQDIAAEIQRSQAAVEAEKQMLEAVTSVVGEGVVVCNAQGQILLYNTRLRGLLEAADAETPLVGLARSIYGVFQPALIHHALQTLHHRRTQGRPADAVPLVAAHGGRLLHLTLCPIDPAEAKAGFVLVISDITADASATARRDYALQALTEGLRGPLGSLRAAIENVQAFPDMDAAQRALFHQVIHDEALRLSQRLTTAATALPSPTRRRVPILADDLLSAVQQKTEALLERSVTVHPPAAPTWLQVDSYALTLALTVLLQRVHAQGPSTDLHLRVKPPADPAFVEVELAWTGARPVHPDELATWRTEPLTAGDEHLPDTLQTVIDRHQGALWSRADQTEAGALCLLLPRAAEAPSAPPVRTAASTGRPLYYDAALLQATPDEHPMRRRALSTLTYVVFDTETTGLRPAEGDAVISVGAVRIVNRRLRAEETFDRLVDPRRPVPLASIRIHGIQPSLLKGQPTITEVLPAFHRFVEDTVLVAHNAAFDLRFLHRDAARCGLTFEHPVLDTLLLSSALLPGHEDHSLDAVAERLGVAVTGRHTALGDALTTGGVFLKLLALLEAEGVTTLEDALTFSQRSPLASLSY
ncbi:MAG: exonuclease domain-containing protein [Bacteroidota bacterium]